MASGFVPYGVGVGVYPSVAAAPTSSVQLSQHHPRHINVIDQDNLENNINPLLHQQQQQQQQQLHHQYSISDGGGGHPSTSNQYPNPSHDQYQQLLLHNQNNQADCGSYYDGNSIMVSGLSLSSSQPMADAPACSDPMGGVGPMSPLMWPLTNEEECATSLWDYGDPFFLDFKGFDS